MRIHTIILPALLLMAVNAGAATVSFQDGLSGYDGTTSVGIVKGRPNQSITSGNSSGTVSLVTEDNLGKLEAQWLVRFDDIMGSTAIPSGATIQSATLRLRVRDDSDALISLYQMQTAWTTATSWNALGDGVKPGTNSAATSASRITGGAEEYVSFNVTNAVTAWQAGSANNYGWALLSSGTNDNWQFYTETYQGNAANKQAFRPLLSVTYAPMMQVNAVPLPAAIWLFGGALSLFAVGRRRRTA
jgi:hypothetical protein